MRPGHFEALRPVCPVCRSGDDQSGAPLLLARIEREESGQIIEGILQCGRPTCQREYPIIDGIPILVGPLRQFISDQLISLLRREDLGAVVESLIGDCCGSGSSVDGLRQQLSCYTWDHYGDADSAEEGRTVDPGGVTRVLDLGLEALSGLNGPPGPLLDVGCSVGRNAFQLAAKTDQMVLGVDLNVAMLRVAAEVLRSGRVRYDRRRVGVVYDRREFTVPLSHAEHVDFWCCDAMALPFQPPTFSFAAALNVVDSIENPAKLLAELARVLVPGGSAFLSAPYDWSTSATPMEHWLGGHSQRGPGAGDSIEWLRRTVAATLPSLKITREWEDEPWAVRLHERSAVHYRCHAALLRRDPTNS